MPLGISKLESVLRFRGYEVSRVPTYCERMLLSKGANRTTVLRPDSSAPPEAMIFGNLLCCNISWLEDKAHSEQRWDLRQSCLCENSFRSRSNCCPAQLGDRRYALKPLAFLQIPSNDARRLSVALCQSSPIDLR